jgi:hypothetical protein
MGLVWMTSPSLNPVGAFAVPLILIGNGLGPLAARELTIKGISRSKQYQFLKNGAMYFSLCLGIIMILDSFGLHIHPWFSPLPTFAVVGFFLFKSVKMMPQSGDA